MTNKKIPNLFIENAEVLPGSFRNFAGRGGKYNKEGERNFNIVVTEDSLMFYEIKENGKKRYKKIGVRDLVDDRWNLRLMRRRDDEEDDAPDRYKLNIAVSFLFRELKTLPPTNVYLYSGKKKTLLDEETIGNLDYAEYRTADLTIRARPWVDKETGETRIKAYLHEMHVTIQPDLWEDKYAEYDKSEAE